MSDRPTDTRTPFAPPSTAVVFENGMWRSRTLTAVSYPEEGNDACLAVEEGSYWFRHRNDMIVAAVRRYPPSGPIYDMGGGNGFVSLAMERTGNAVVLVEPGSGARNAVRRGVTNVIHGTLEDAAFEETSIDAVGVFDAVEHIEHEHRVLNGIHRVLVPGGRVYCDVPAGRWLWSEEDVTAGHFLRYTRSSLRDSFQRAGFQVEYLSSFFSWLHLPILLFRTLPYRLGRHRPVTPDHAATKADHSLPAPLRPIAAAAHRWELERISRGATTPLGTSLICVARSA